MPQDLRISIIGCGIMGSSIIEGLLQKNIVVANNIFGCDPNHSRLAELSNNLAIQSTASIGTAIQSSDIIIIAVKPQSSEQVFLELKGSIDQQLVISIMAGISVSHILNKTGAHHIIRVMPNTPAQIGEGFSVWHASAAVTEEQKQICKTILGSLGESLEVAEEDMINKATALTGSGPAYIFYLAEQMIHTAQAMGFSADQSEQMIKKLFSGSVQLWKQSKIDAEQLRKNVTSPGGTTEAAIRVMDQEKMPEIVNRAIRRAYERAGELGVN